MTDFVQSLLFVLAVVVVVVVLPLTWLRRNRRARRMKEEQQAAEFEHRLLHPDYAAFRSHYGCEAPLPLRRLYEDRGSVLDSNFNLLLPSSRSRYSVAWFEPMEDKEWPDMEGFYAFANDGCGNQYLVDPQEADPEVVFLDHETGKRESLGVRLSQFLTAERKRRELLRRPSGSPGGLPRPALRSPASSALKQAPGTLVVVLGLIVAGINPGPSVPASAPTAVSLTSYHAAARGSPRTASISSSMSMIYLPGEEAVDRSASAS
jgi:hypothetical protein